MKKKQFLLPLLMAIVMMAMSPQKVWALSGDGTSASPYLIYNATDLKDFRTNVNNGTKSDAVAKLMNNITLSDTWTPIGVNGHTYSGTFLGQNHTISGMSMNVTGWEEGLFGWIQGATIQDLTVSGQMTSTTTDGNCRESIGGVVGLARGVNTITNVHSNVNITMNHNNFKGVGGVVGKAEENYGISTIKNCSYSGTLTLNSNIGYVGGIVGYVTQGATITNCNFTGTIKTCDGCDYIGGIVGFFYRGDYTVTISNCTNAGAMTLGKGSEIGGIFGHAAGNLNILNNTFASGATINTATSSTACGFVAGIAGKTDGTILIQECTAAGSINVGASYDCIAGIVGYCQPNSSLTIKSCLYSGHISNTSTNSDINRVAGIIAYATDNGNNFGGIKGCLCSGSFSTPSSNTIKPAAIASALYDNALDRMTDNYYRSDMATAVVFHYSGGHSINTSSNVSRTADQIGSGQVAYELYSGSIDGHTSWRQNITSGTVDNNPVLDQTHNRVYNTKHYNCSGTLLQSYTNSSTSYTDGHGSTGYTETYSWSGTCYNDASKDTKACSFTLKCNFCSTNVVNGKSLTCTKTAHTDATCTATGKTTYSATGSYTSTNSSYNYSATKTYDYTVAMLAHSYNDGICTGCNDWETPSGNGTASSPYIIKNQGTLLWFGKKCRGTNTGTRNFHALQTNDIVYTQSDYWWGIGSSNNMYYGTYNGGGHTISGLHCKPAANISTFGYIGGNGKVMNLGIINVNYYSKSTCYSSAIASENYGTIENCYATGSVEGGSVAGICYSNSGYIKNCYSTVTLTADNGVTYPICSQTTNVTNCYHTSTTSASDFSSGKVCYLLNNSTNGGATWYQNLASGGDAYPVLKANDSYKVYQYTHTYCSGTQEARYTNSSTQQNTSDTHTFTNKTAENAYLKTAATCATDAVYYHKCENCDVSSQNNTNTTWTKTGSATGNHSFGSDATRSVCTVCNHGFFRYSSTDNNPVTPNNASQLLGADGNALSFTNKYVEAEGKCIMEFNKPLVTIGYVALRQCTGFTGDLIIPNSVKNIGNYAFFKCGFTGTGTLTIGSSVESIGYMAFKDCTNLTYVEMKSVPSVGEFAFNDNVNKTLILCDDSYVYTGGNPNFPTINSFSYPRTVTGGNIVTFVLPVSVPVSSINGKVWKFSTYEDDKFKFTAVTDDNTEANVPYLVQLDKSATELLDDNITGDLTINAPGTPMVTSADGLVTHIGSYTKQSVASDANSAYYGFSQASHQFVKATTGTLNPFRTMFEIDNFRRFYDWASLNPENTGKIDTSLDGDNWPDNTRDYTFTAKAGDVLSFNYKVSSDGCYQDYGHLKVYLCNDTPTFANYKNGEKILEKYGDSNSKFCVTGEYNKVFDTEGKYTLVFEYVGCTTNDSDDKAWVTNIKLTPLASSSTNNAKAYIDLQLGMDDDDATKIIRVDADAVMGTGSPMYNLQGQRITKPVKGQVYIRNGKKVLY